MATECNSMRSRTSFRQLADHARVGTTPTGPLLEQAAYRFDRTRSSVLLPLWKEEVQHLGMCVIISIAAVFVIGLIVIEIIRSAIDVL